MLAKKIKLMIIGLKHDFFSLCIRICEKYQAKVIILHELGGWFDDKMELCRCDLYEMNPYKDNK